MERIQLSKKQRFAVFKRDGFCCQYCGAVPPSAVLEVDHINPVANGGKNNIDNLITACFDCNRGKGAEPLTVAPQSVVEKATLLQEKMDQLRAFEKLQKQQQKLVEKSVDVVEGAFQEHFPDRQFTSKFRLSVRTFLESLDTVQLESYMQSACVKQADRPDQAIKYFCGICWNVIKGKGR